MGFRQEHFRTFALYNAWANERLYGCAAQLTPEALAEDRGPSSARFSGRSTTSSSRTACG